MKVGDLVKYKHDQKLMGLVTKIDPNIHDSVTYQVWVMFPPGPLPGREKVTYNYQLEVINAQD